MLSCLDADPEQRPTFAQLVTTVTSVLDPLADYLNVNHLRQWRGDRDRNGYHGISGCGESRGGQPRRN